MGAADDTYYITTHEAALAVVATAMKKSRLRLDILIINSIIGAFFFSAGGMLDLMVQSRNPGLVENYLGIISIFQGSVYSLGLFYVVIMGMELFNSNVLFFSVALMRGAVTFLDLIINWFVSFFVNLGATIFVAYVLNYCSGITRDSYFIRGSIEIATEKESFTFVETFIKGINCNFFVSLAIYLQIMVKPVHVKLIMIYLPVFTFVSMGFSHVVADMYLIPAGLFNGAPFSWGTYFWKICLPAALGNIVGGSFFGIVITWYLHLVVIERDMKKLNLPEYEERDEQPQLNMDSRVVRVRKSSHSTSSSDSNSNDTDTNSNSSRNTTSSSLLNNNINTSSEDDDYGDEKFVSSSSNDESVKQKQQQQQKLSQQLSQQLTHQQQQPEYLPPVNLSRQQSVVSKLSGLSRAATVNSRLTRRRTRRTDIGSIYDNNSLNKIPSKKIRSPKGVFPVMGMGEPLKREKTIASAYLHHNNDEDDDDDDDDDEEYDEIANPYHQRNISDILDDHNNSGIQLQTTHLSSDSSSTSAPVATAPQDFNPAPLSTSGYDDDDAVTNNDDDDDDALDNLDDYDEDMDPIHSIYTTTSTTGDRRKKKFVDNPYNPEDETMGGMLKQVLTRVRTRAPTISSNHTNNNNHAIPDIERGEGGGINPSISNKSAPPANDSALSRVISHVITRVVSNPSLYNVDPSSDTTRRNQKKNTAGLSRQMTKINDGRGGRGVNSIKRSKTISVNDKTLMRTKTNMNNTKGSLVEAALNQFSFSGGHNSEDIHKKLTEARITPKAAALANDVAGIYNDSVHVHVHEADKRRKKLLQKKLKKKRNNNSNNSINNNGSGSVSGRKVSYPRSDSIRSKLSNNANMNNTTNTTISNNNENTNNNSVINLNRSSIFNEDDVLSLDSYDSNCSPINYDFLNSNEGNSNEGNSNVGNSNDHDNNQTTVAGPDITQPDKSQDESNDIKPQSQSQSQLEKDK
ncbi:hypothetical protein B5S31_g1438 [[Candida] boidinii]|nr:hypothetical protein B5S31_g1438 [[Candida] boidinii]